MRSHLFRRAASLLLAAGLSAQAQDVVVTAARTPQRASEAIAEVSVIGAEAIERAPGRTLAELLALQPGLQSSSNGGLGKTASVFIRGMEARHTLLLVDGVPLGSASVGSPSLDNLPLAAIERIEVVRGPLSSLFGSGAMGGVVQVFLKRADAGPAGAEWRISAGNHGQAQFAAGAAALLGAIDVAAGVQHVRTRGFSATDARVPFGNHHPDDDGFRQNAGSLRLGLALQPDWRLELLALRAEARSEFDDGAGANSRAGLSSEVLSLSLVGRPAPGWRSRVTLAGSLDAFDTQVTASAFTPLGTTRTRQQQASWQNDLATPAGNLLLLLESIEQRVARPAEAFAVDRRTIDAVAAGLAGSAGAHHWQAGLRRDRNSQFGSRDSGSGGYAVALSPAWRVGASAGSSFVAPSFNQLYFPNFGNPLLQPETGRHGEAFVAWQDGGAQLRLTAWRQRVRGFITSGQNPVNLPRAEIDGVTLGGTLRGAFGTLHASFDQLDARNATAGSANAGKRLPRRAERALRLQADANHGAWTFGSLLAAFGHRFDDAANRNRLAGYATLDLRAERRLADGWSVALALNNALDKRYQTALGFNQPPREWLATLRWSLR